MQFINALIEKTEQLQQQLEQIWRALQASESRFRNVIEKSADGIIIVDRDGIVRFVNRAAEALLCRSADDLVGEIFGFPLVANDTTELDIVCPREKKRVAEMRVVESEWEGEFVYLASLRDITDRKLAELQIRAALREKEILLQEIHHRVKNNLSIVSGLLSVQADLIEDEQTRAAFQESQNRIHSIARIHEHLYQSVDLARIDMADYIHNLIDFLQMSYGAYEVAVTVEVPDDLTLDIQAAIPCGLIVNELVSNIFKYAFPPQPEKQNGAGRKVDQKVWVELFESVEAELVMVVRDNGQGLSPDFDWRNAPTLGLQLVNLLARQSQGRVEVELASGTAFKIFFPPT